jgi:hypothetical protein
MREHPIPQDLTGYRFHIIGSMTLKQFVEVAAGVVVAIILYNTNLIIIVKWPLILISVGIGALMAFVPFAERPLDHWITTFFTVLYNPTKFFWRKQGKIPDPFLFKPRVGQVNVNEEVDLSPARRVRIQEYITSVTPEKTVDPLEQAEQAQINALMLSFDSVQVSDVSIKKTIQKPNLTTRVRDLQAHDVPTPTEPQITPEITATPIAPVPMPTPEPEPAPLPPQPSISVEEPPVPTTPAEPTVSAVPAAAVSAPEPEQAADTTTSDTTTDFMAPTAPAATVAPPSTTVVTNVNLPFPTQPSVPNKLVGMVLSPDQKIIAEAIIEIKNRQGLVARAVKSNALGQFFITTPLENGTYVVEAEKTGFTFEPQQLALTGEIVAPLQIVATALA